MTCKLVLEDPQGHGLSSEITTLVFTQEMNASHSLVVCKAFHLTLHIHNTYNLPKRHAGA